MFELAAHIEGVGLIPDATDPLGRGGSGIVSATASNETELIVDPAHRPFPPRHPTSQNHHGHLSWVAYAE